MQIVKGDGACFLLSLFLAGEDGVETSRSLFSIWVHVLLVHWRGGVKESIPRNVRLIFLKELNRKQLNLFFSLAQPHRVRRQN